MYSYLGITGATIKFDKNGDSEGNFSVLAFKESDISEKMKSEPTFFHCPSYMVPVGQFQQGENSPVSYEIK